VKTTSAGYRDKLRTKAGDVFDENKRDFKEKALVHAQSKLGVLGPELIPSTVAGYTDEEYKKCDQISANADKVHDKVVTEHRSTEDKRKGRLDGIKGEAAGLSGLKGMESVSVAKALVKKLESETGGVSADQDAALESALTAYSNAANKSF